MRRVAPRLVTPNLVAELSGALVVAVPLDAAAPPQRQLPGELAIELLPGFNPEAIEQKVGEQLLRVRRVDPRERVCRGAAARPRAFDERHLRAALREPVREVRADDPAAGDDDPFARRVREARYACEGRAGDELKERASIE